MFSGCLLQFLLRPGFMEDKLLVDNKLYAIEVGHTNSNRIGYVKLKADRIIVKIPSKISKHEQFSMYRKLIAKAQKYLQRHKNIESLEKPEIDFYNKQTVEVMGRQFSINIIEIDSKTSKAAIDGNAITIYLSSSLSKERASSITSNLARRAISTIILPDFISRIDQFNSQFFQSNISTVRLKDNSTNWGSCSRKNRINLDFRLAFAPDKIRDAVIIHELAHTVHRNHSKKFWDLVYSIIPDYKERRRWLNENKHKLVPGYKFDGVS